MTRIALFASGTGTNALNLIEHAKKLANIEIACVVIDTKTSSLPTVLSEKYSHIPVHTILPNDSIPKAERRMEHEGRIIEVLNRYQVRWGMLAGYMRIVGPRLLNYFGMQRLVNIHPSLLPAYPGLHAFERAYADNVSESGITIHLVDAGMDTGPILLQKSFPRYKEDSLSDFINRGKAIEWELYPQILQQLNAASAGV